MVDEKQVWSWPRLIEALRGPNNPDRTWATRCFLELLVAGFTKLREELEDETCSTSWKEASIGFRFEFPFEWEHGGEVEPKDARDQDLARAWVLFKLMTAGVAFVRFPNGKKVPLIPEPIGRHLDGCSNAERDRVSKSWFDLDRWLEDRLTREFLRPPDGDIVGRATDGRSFTADLRLAVSQHIFDHASRRSYFNLKIGIRWYAPAPRLEPKNWSEGERQAFWSTVSRFLSELERRCNGESIAKSFTTKVESGQAMESFRASFVTSSGDYYAKVIPPSLGSSALKNVPAWALGTEGPVLDILDGEGRIHPMAFFRTLALMAHPKEERPRNQLLARWECLFASTASPEALKEVFPGLPEDKAWNLCREVLTSRFGLYSYASTKALGEALSHKDAIDPHSRGFFCGAVAGDMLLVLLSCAAHHPELLSVNKAAHLMASKLREVGFGDGSPIRCDDSKVKEWWSAARSVAHLWAANRILTEGPPEKRFSLEDHDFLPKLVAISESLRRQSEQTFAPRQRVKHGPILDPTKTWRAPGSFHAADVNLVHPPLPEESLDLLRGYKPTVVRHSAELVQ